MGALATGSDEIMNDHLSSPASGAEPAPATLDPRGLDAIRTLDPERHCRLVEEAVTIYLDDAPVRMEQMAAGLHSGDAEALRRAAHTLKSASANMGAERLAAQCNELESGARDGDLHVCASLLAAAQQEYGRVAAALRQVPEMRADHVTP